MPSAASLHIACIGQIAGDHLLLLIVLLLIAAYCCLSLLLYIAGVGRTAQPGCECQLGLGFQSRASLASVALAAACTRCCAATSSVTCLPCCSGAGPGSAFWPVVGCRACCPTQPSALVAPVVKIQSLLGAHFLGVATDLFAESAAGLVLGS